jgi:hypothetical protein
MVMLLNILNVDIVMLQLVCLRYNHSTWTFMPLNVFGINIWLSSAWTFNLDGYAPLNIFNLDSYAVESLRHNHSTWKTVDCLRHNHSTWKTVDCLRHNHSTWVVMPLNVFGITIQLGWLCRWMSSAWSFNLDVYAVECLRHKHLTVFGINIQLGFLCRWMSSTWIVMALKVFGITIQLGRQLTVFGMTILLWWLCRWMHVFGITIQFGCLCRWMSSA